MLLFFTFLPTLAVDPSPPFDATARLEKLGRVRYEYVVRAAGDTNYPGHTTFTLSFKAPSWTSKFTTQTHGRKTFLIINPVIPAAEVTLEHQVRLPGGYATTNRWFAGLIKHEFDHVAISTDPRPRRLLEHLILNLKRFEVEAPEGVEIDRTLINRLILEELRRRNDAVANVIRQNYEHLDTLTRHGSVRIADRAKFFASLYSKERLQELNFRYLEDALNFLSSERYHREFEQ